LRAHGYRGSGAPCERRPRLVTTAPPYGGRTTRASGVATDWPSARRAWRSYEDLPLATRLFLAGRLVVLPFGELDGELRRLHGRVLSLGVGYGLVERYLAEVNAGVEIDGVDLDEARIAVAQRTAARYP